jgi:hypothetical protein
MTNTEFTPSPVTVMTTLWPGGAPRPHLWAGHASPAACDAAVVHLEREVPEGASVVFTAHTLYTDVSADHGEIAAYVRTGGRWVPRPLTQRLVP